MSENADKVEKAKERIILEMENDERYKSFFAPYRADSVKSFIKSYARNKARLEVYGNLKHKIDQNIIEECRKVSWECLEEIQQKKFFDLSCLWYAGQVKNIPEIDISMSFRITENRILDYKGISSISEEDIHFYLRYLNEEKKALGYFHHCEEYQYYSHLKKHYKKHRKTGILYYDYHNRHTGNDSLLSLKAIKMKKEDAYIATAREKEREKAPVTIVKETKPHLNYFEEDIVDFAKKFNDQKTASYIESVLEFKSNRQTADKEWAIDYLEQLRGEEVSVSAGKNWLKALYKAAIAHRREKVKEMLPAIYEEYLMKISAGIQFAPYDKLDHTYGFEERYKKLIMDGRELCGQPRNFDY